MPVKKLKEFLDQNAVKYVSITHSQAFTAQQVAASTHIPGQEMAKTVIVKFNDRLAMAVLPASYRIDLERLHQLIGEKVTLASEMEFKDEFPGCEVGAMPPFGHLYGMETFVAARLAEDEEIAFNAGSHTEVIRMSFKDFQRLEQPKILQFSA